MFEKFKELFGSENLLDMAFHTTVTMLEFDQQMFASSRDTLRHTSTTTLPFDVRQMDRKINKYEREVRRNVLTHLSVAGTQNLVPGLVLVSIVIDVERIGDYTKNISGLASLHKAPLKGANYENILTELEGRIDTHFAKTIDVLKSQDKRTARSVMALEEEIASSAETIVSDMIQNKDKSMSTPDAVSLAMYARYLKRINAHLTNIASAIVNPFPRIGFREKKQ